jgi:hypothetical protein
MASMGVAGSGRSASQTSQKDLAKKAYLLTEKKAKIPCLFNPENFSLSMQNSWNSEARPGQDVQVAQFTGASAGTLSLTLFFDTTDTGSDVTSYTNQLQQLMAIDPSLQGTKSTSNNQRPPWVKFCWGNFQSWPAVITSLSLTFEYFSSSGTPLRARASLSLQQYTDPNRLPRQNPTSGTPRPHRVHRVQRGETLDRIAAQHLGKATAWRAIADANGLDDPLALAPGRYLAIPANT